MRGLSAICIVVMLGGCAITPSMKQVDPGENSVNDRMLLKVDGAWNEIVVPEANTAVRTALDLGPARIWTMDGVPVDRLLVYAGVSDGEAIHPPHGAQSKSFTFRANMQADEVVGLFEGLLTRDGSVFKLIRLEPTLLGNAKGFRFEFSVLRKLDNLPLAGLGFAAVVNEQLYALVYTAPRLGFFPRYRTRIEQMAHSARITTLRASQSAPAAPTKTALLKVPVPGNLAPEMPRPGDLWKYQYVDGFSGQSKQIFVHEIVGVTPDEIAEKMYLAGQSAFADSQSFTVSAAPRLFRRPLPGFSRPEFAPFLQAFRPGVAGGAFAPIADLPSDMSTWQLSARMVGRERVVVPAGSFDALKIQITGERPGRSQIAEPVRMQHTIWYAPKVKRYVRYEVNSWSANGFQLDRDRFELVDFKLN